MSCVGFWMTGISVLAVCLRNGIFSMALYIVFSFELFDAKFELVNWILQQYIMGLNLLPQVQLAPQSSKYVLICFSIVSSAILVMLGFACLQLFLHKLFEQFYATLFADILLLFLMCF
jgi:hypothetical protein